MPACAVTYTVVSGDYWIKIASKAGVTTSALYAANNASATTPLYPGQQVCLPAGASAPTTTTPPATTVPPADGTVALAAFPAQGLCSYTDTWQAPRGGGRLHEGVDLIAKTGQYVYAVQDGTLSKQAVDKPGSLSGNAWWLTTADGTYYFYAHLSAFAPGLQLGAKVKAGQIIGFIGSTGNAGVSHLHFEVHPKGGAAVNPTPIVKAVDGCKTTQPPAQPGGNVPAVPPPTAPPATAPPATTPPAPTAPPAPVVVLPPSGPVSTQPGSLWQFVSPMTAFDSNASGRLSGGVTRTMRVNHLAGVPAATAGVIVRLTASEPAAAGYLVTHACDVAPPVASTLSFTPGRTSVGSTAIRVTGGNVCVTASTSVKLKVEVLAAQAASGVGLQPVSAARAVDTRETTRLVPGATLSLSPGALGATTGTQALSASVTLVNPAAAGTLSMGFCGQGGWKVPFTADPVSSFAITMRVSNTGWCLTSSVATDVIVDVVGNWTSGGALMGVVDPVRVYDSRAAGGPVGIGAVGVPIAGLGGVPAGATVAMLSVTTVTGGQGSSVFLVPCGEGRSAGTVIASSAYRIATAVVPVALGGGAVCISSFHAIDVIIDVVGAG